jgi:hypothetical protein
VWPDRFVAPKDLVAQGTWLGINRRGHFVGITNRAHSPVDPHAPSRGQLVVDALKLESTHHLSNWLTEPVASAFNPFHLLSFDFTHGFVFCRSQKPLRVQRLSVGLHVITERSFSDDTRREAVIHRLWQSLPHRDELPSLEGIIDVLSHREEDPFASVCVNAPQFNYGTRSSFIYFGGPKMTDARLYVSDGPPSRESFVERSALVHSLATSD